MKAPVKNPMKRITNERFERLVSEALDMLPRRYLKLIRNVVVLIEEEPAPQLLEELGMEAGSELFGLYSGIPLGHESFFDTGGRVPPQILIFRGPILRHCASENEVRKEIMRTVMHEVGHHFGLTDSMMPY